MALDEEVLEAVAKDGSMDYEKWPGMLEPLLERLDHIVHDDFPMPKMPPELAQTFTSQQSSFPSSFQTQDASFPTSSNKENAPPGDLQTPPRPPVPAFSDTTERIPDSQQSAPGPADDTLPPPLLLILNSTKSTLRSYFSSKPPHTIQRLAELILRPTRHYRTLPAYLRAVDRVVSVSSSADTFPLPQTAYLGDSSAANGQANGGAFMVTDNSLGSDESLGGALLTPIPWLSNTALEDAGSDPLDEGRESGGVTQGELIRQEQEAGIVVTSHVVASSEGIDARTSPEAEEDAPHARGPSVLGVEDMGLQDGKGIEMTLSSQAAPKNGVDASVTEQGQPEGLDAANGTNGNPDSDGDIVLSDAAGRTGQQDTENTLAGSATQKEGASKEASTEQDADADEDA
ncbi:hypothetical protein Plec18167_008130 [Paecilomyces lecythidis]|uniref:Uncharacterized protein n=1 Tax=Paecilomyces lecythidis TaxID=3004212 RepID=A0ABR3WYR0_9EURO